MSTTRLSLKEASEITGYHPDYISALIRQGKIKGEKIGRNWFTSRDEVETNLSSKHFRPFGIFFLKKTALFIGSALLVFIMIWVYVAITENDKSTRRNIPDELEPIVETIR